MTDADLLGRIAAGDKAAMKALYERHSDALYHFVRGRLGDAFEAADVMQDTFVEVWRHADRWQGRSTVKTWIFGIARNKAVDRVRRAVRTEVREPDDTLPDEDPTPEAIIAAASDAARVRACIGELGEAMRTAVRLAFFDDLSYPEIAEVEGVPLGTIKTRIHHAKKLLMRCITRTPAAA